MPNPSFSPKRLVYIDLREVPRLSAVRYRPMIGICCPDFGKPNSPNFIGPRAPPRLETEIWLSKLGSRFLSASAQCSRLGFSKDVLAEGRFGYRRPADRPKIDNVRTSLPFPLPQLIKEQVDNRCQRKDDVGIVIARLRQKLLRMYDQTPHGLLGVKQSWVRCNTAASYEMAPKASPRP